MSVPKGAGGWLLALTLGACGGGCTHAPLQQPTALLEEAAPRARGQLADDLERSPAPRIAAAPVAANPLPSNAALSSASAPANAISVSAASPGFSSAASPAPAVQAESDLRRLCRLATATFAALDGYQARLRRREQVNGVDKPEEVLLFKFRKQPWSVYFKWLGAQGRGREVVYVYGQHGNLIHTRLAAGDMPLASAGQHMALAPDNIFVRSASRHAITEAGIGVLIQKFHFLLDAADRGDRRYGSLRYLGRVKRPEYEAPMEAVEQLIPAGAEAALPRGGRRWVLFETTTYLPVLVITQDARGHEVEYYCYDQIQTGVHLGDDDFNPAKLWPR